MYIELDIGKVTVRLVSPGVSIATSNEAWTIGRYADYTGDVPIAPPTIVKVATGHSTQNCSFDYLNERTALKVFHLWPDKRGAH